MHIAIDARELAGRRTGVGTYLAHLLEEWGRMEAAAAHRWTLYAPSASPALGARPHDKSVTKGGVFDQRSVAGGAGTWWEQTALASALRHDRPDVLFAPGYTAPLRTRVPVVLTVHDVSFFAHPEWFNVRQGFRRRLVTRWAARRARSILTVSEFSRSEIVRWLGVPAERVRVIRHGISAPRVATPGGDAGAELSVHAPRRPPVVLYVGSILNRRHVPDLIRAFADVLSKVPDARLEIVGENRTHPCEELAALAGELGASDRVALRSYVPEEELTSLYEQAAVFAFLSEYEGFGFTPAEALAHRVPIVVLDTPVAREVYGDAALYVGVDDIHATAGALVRMLTDPQLRSRQLANAQSVLARYRWPEAARLTLDAIEQAGARG